MADEPVPGIVYASHAETKLREWMRQRGVISEMAVNNRQCFNCKEYFWRTLREGEVIPVADTEVVRIYKSEGITIIDRKTRSWRFISANDVNALLANGKEIP